MPYGQPFRAPSQGAPVAEAAAVALTWRRLDEAQRLQLIDRALRPANDLIDAYPLAL